MNERAKRIEEAARALLSAKEAEIAKCRADNADTPDFVCDWCREEEEQIAPLRAALALPVEEPNTDVEVIRKGVPAPTLYLDDGQGHRYDCRCIQKGGTICTCEDTVTLREETPHDE